MGSSLSSFINNLAKGIDKIKMKYKHDIKTCETCKIKYKYCKCFLEYTHFKDDLIEYNCLSANKNYPKSFIEP